MSAESGRTLHSEATALQRARESMDGLDVAGDRLALPFAEQFALWAMRLWVEGQRGGRRGQPVEHMLEGAFHRLRQPQAGRRLELFMLSLAHGAIRPIRLWPACSRPISDDERRLLDLLALAQQGERFSPALLCRGFLRPRAGAVSAALAHDLAACLAEAGMRLAIPGAPASENPRDGGSDV